MKPPRYLTAAVMLLTMLLLIAPVSGEEPASRSRIETEPTAETVAPIPGPGSSPSTLAVRIEEIMAKEREKVTALGEKIASAGDTTVVMSLQRQVQVVKLQAERDILALQLATDRQKAAPAQITQIEASINALDELLIKVKGRLTNEAPADNLQR